MDGKLHSLFAVICLAAVFGLSAAAEAAPPWDQLLSPSRVEADDSNDYKLTYEAGPWMIMATSFSGAGAEKQAHDLVMEIRKRYKLPAYVHRMSFDFSQNVAGRGIDKFGNPVKMRYQRGSQLEEIAVLVGNYSSVNDNKAQEVLQKLKYAQPNCLRLKDGKKTNQTLAGWRWAQKQLQEAIGSKKKEKGPMGHAFVTTNPLLPKEYFVPNGVDEFVVKINDGVEHSLMDCPGKFTVQVAHFTGKTIIDQETVQKELKKGNALDGSQLQAAAEKAHRLTEALRMKGYEAYEFHDRAASIVTVGSFDSTGTPRQDGKIEINPQVHHVIKTFRAKMTQDTSQPNGAMQPRSLAGIPFDVQPIPVEVPRRSISTALRQNSNKSNW